MTDRTCAVEGCDNPPRSPQAKTCSPECSALLRTARVRRWHRDRYQPRPKTPRECKVCGTVYLAHKGCYCSGVCKDRGSAQLRASGIRWACSKCGVPMPEATGRPGVRVCDGCKVDKRDPVKQAEKERRRTLRKYGITQADYDYMLADQGGRCAVCLTDEPGGNKSAWHIDHCHETGKVRGLLCHGCNTGLGLFADSPALLRMAAHYLTSSRHREEAAS